MKHLLSNTLLNAAAMFALPVALLGCGDSPARYPVAGKVLIDGEPLQTGSIRFVPEHGRPATSSIRSDGTYSLNLASLSSDPRLKGIPPGKYRVAVSAANVLDEDAEKVEWLAPSKYADFRTSEIEFLIDGPHADLDVDLTWEGNELPEPAEEENQESRDPAVIKSIEHEASSEK